MGVETLTLPVYKSSVFRAVVIGGLAAGLLDITSAFINGGLRGRSPMWVLQSIAAGLLGMDSFNGGLPATALGAGLHFLVAFVACAVYVAASLKLRFLIERVVFSGLLYGIAVYAFMYGVVLPLTFHRNFFRPFSAVLLGVVIHMFCVGLPIAVVTGWQLKRCDQRAASS